MAGLLDSKIITGEKSGYRVEVSDKSVTVKDSYTVSAKTGKSVSALSTENTISVSTYEGGSKISKTNTVKATEGKTVFAAPDADLTVSRTESSATYGSGASTVDSVSESVSYSAGGYKVDVKQTDKTAQNQAGVLHKQEESVIAAKSKQIPQILKDSEREIEELVFAEKGSSVSVGESVWKSGTRTEFEKGSSEYEISGLNAKAQASAKATAGTEGLKANASAGASVSALQGSSSITYGSIKAGSEFSALTAQASASAGAKAGLDGIEASVKAGASVTVAEYSAAVGAGDGNLGAKLGASAKVLSASADAGAKIGYAKNEKTGQYELNANVSAEVNAVIAEANVNAAFSVAGVDLGAQAGVYVGAGAKFKVGIENNNMVFDIGAALGIGFNLKFTIGFNDEFIKNIQNIISQPGAQYVNSNPYFKADTDKLRNYAARINNVNVRLRQLDNDLRTLYWQVGFLDLFDIMMENLLTSGSPTLNQVKLFLEQAALRLEAADNKARGIMEG